MPGIIIEDLDIIADTRVYDLAKYYGLKDRTDRIQHKKALQEIIKWGEAKSKSQDISDIIKVVRRQEKKLVRDGSEPTINNFHRFVYFDNTYTEEPERPKVKQQPKPEKKIETKEPEVTEVTEEIKEEPREEVKLEIKEPEPNYGELFKQGMESI